MTPRSRLRPRAGTVLVVVAACVALLAACAETQPTDPAGSPTSTSVVPRTPSPTKGVTVDPELQRVVDAAVADLTSRQSSGEGAVRVVLARHETFPDGALGCPKPGMSYTQALVDGFRVVLERDDRRWLYTAGDNGVPRLCR